MDKARQNQLKIFQHAIKYKFKNRELLNTALTHKSYAFEHPKNVHEWNERLEFFGDSVLGLVISEYLYKRFKNLQEGELSKLKSQVVCTETLNKNALRLCMGNYLLLGRGEEHSGGRRQISNLSCALEAVIGAVYLDRDINAAKKFIAEIFKEDLNDIQKNRKAIKDYKSAFQEQTLKRFGRIPHYELTSQDGPEHKKEFVISVRVNGQICGRGWGLSKKSAEQMAAKEALEFLLHRT
jgi:ribonuclease-3